MNSNKNIVVIKIVILALLVIGGSSCEKVIFIDLNKANPQMVIEGVVTDQPGPYVVVLSKSGNYFEPSLYFPPVTHALVIITEDKGISDTLREVQDGTYLTSKIIGTSGRTYDMKVVADGNEYDAASTMPEKIKIDSVYATPLKEADGDRGYYVNVMFKDPPQQGNYYCLSLHTNLMISDSITGQRYILYTDKLTNGNEANVRIRSGRKNLFPGDILTVELLSIDDPTYEYYHTVNAILSSDRSPTSLSPANPNTNINNGALGYFAAYTIDSARIALP